MFRRILLELRSVLSHLSVLAGLVLVSLLLFGMSAWLAERGGLPLLVLGLTGLWSAALAGAMIYLDHRRRLRDRAIDMALERLRAAINAPAAEGERDERR
jgi:hypothetical protein